MERITFLVEGTGERISCLLNPEELLQRRTSGVRRAQAGSGPITGAGLTDEPLLHTGGGRTELDLQLLFDISLVASTSDVTDVRQLTKPLWDLSENSAGSADREGWAVPAVRFVWGKAWNVLGVVVAVSEKLERFDAGGAPSRSWMSLRLRRVPEPPVAPIDPPSGVLPAGDELVGAARSAPVQQIRTVIGAGASADAVLSPQDGGLDQRGERLDEIAAQVYGGASWLWRWLAAANGLDDAPFVPAGTELSVPSAPGPSR